MRYGELATRAGELLLARGDTERARVLAEQAIAVEPWLDAAHRLVITAHWTARDACGAQQAIDRYREANREVGLDPDHVTRMVERLPRPDRSSSPATMPRGSHPPIRTTS